MPVLPIGELLHGMQRVMAVRVLCCPCDVVGEDADGR